MRIAPILVTLLLTLPRLWAASSAINGELFVAAGTSGTNALPSSRTTNVTISATSKVTDGTTAYKFDTSLNHTSGNLLEVANNGTNAVTIGYAGGVGIGKDLANAYGPLTAGTAFVGAFFADLEGTGNFTSKLSADDTTGFNYGASITQSLSLTDADNSYSSLSILGYGNPSGTPGWEFFGGVQGGLHFARQKYRTSFLAEPTIADGSTPYLLGSEITHTSGNLFEIRNNGTLRAEVVSTGELALFGASSHLIDFDIAGPAIHMQVGASEYFRAQTEAGDGVTPYLADTRVSHTTGDLLEVKNNGTNTMALDYNGGLTLGRSASQGSIAMGDADGSNSLRITPAAVTTTDVNLIGPAAPFNGVPLYTVSSSTNFTMSGPAKVSDILGVTDASQAAAGYVGEYKSNLVASASAVSAAVSGTSFNITSISLTAGDWDVEGTVILTATGYSTGQTFYPYGKITTTSAEAPTATGGESYMTTSLPATAGTVTLPLTRKQINVSTTTTVYLVANLTYSSGTWTGWGNITARRVR